MNEKFVAAKAAEKEKDKKLDEAMQIISERELAVIKVIDSLNEKDAELDMVNSRLNEAIKKLD